MELVRLSDGARLATWRTDAADAAVAAVAADAAGAAGAGDAAGAADAADAVGGPGDPVVLLHGGPGLWDYLEPLGDLIGAGRTVYRYDQRDCGRSLPADGPERAGQSMARSVQDLEELRAHWGADRLALVGHSFGATLALAYAGTHPGRAAVVVYLGGVGIGDWRTPNRAALARIQAPYAARLDELSAKDRTWDEEVEWRRLTWASDYADPAAGLELARPMAETRLPISWSVNATLRFSDDDVLPWARAVTCPVALVHGAADPRPAANVVALAAHLPRARVRIIAGAGHLPWVERPAETGAALREVLRPAA
ncbi:proline iminopeptidase [Promicromonospora sp. AC04]|uniref:alpha/beta fold hydrolase n=1 Tax=Promicromonospora sp. AC04 TaxID=2135723 RepID=UPI000D395A0E|nr:alpha/beta hydrolase [Promicromonospora sp. AC04]PUB26287.1 proline iminopeptidase [Promicromonospora sp. AC04]